MNRIDSQVRREQACLLVHFGMNLSKCSRRLSPSSSERSSDGDGEVRTLDPLLARQVLSQLSYIPMCRFLRRSRLLQSPKTLKRIWQPPALPGRLQPSTIGRLGLNHRVRDGNGCDPQANNHQKLCVSLSELRNRTEFRGKLAFQRSSGRFLMRAEPHHLKTVGLEVGSLTLTTQQRNNLYSSS